MTIAPVRPILAETVEPFRLTSMTARELCALPDPERGDELLGPLLIRGQRLILGGHTGEGKTTMALQILRAVVCGSRFLDWKGAGDCRALVIDAEQGLKSIKRRLREAGLSNSDAVDYIRAPDGLTLNENAEQVAAVGELLAAGGYDLVLADPLYKLHRGESNDERAAVDLMRLFDRWREALNFGLMLPVHCRKPAPGMAAALTIHDLFGSSGYVRGAEVVLGLSRVRSGYARLYWLKDRDGDLPIGTKWGLLFDREHGYRRDPDDEKPSTSEQVRDLRATDPKITQTEAAKIIDVSVRTIRTYWHDEPADEPSTPSLLDD